MQKEQILSYLANIKSGLSRQGIDRIGLFGSFAKDRANALSDIDIAIKLRKNYLDEHDVWEYFTLLEEIRRMLLKKFSRKIDIYDVDSTGSLNHTITKEIIYV